MNRQPTPANILDNILTTDVAPDRTALRSRLRWDYAQVAPVDRKAVEDAAVDILANGQRVQQVMQQSSVAIGERLLVDEAAASGVDDDDVVAAIDMRGVGGQVFAAQAHGDERGETTDDQTLGVDHDPLLRHFGGLGRERAHV